MTFKINKSAADLKRSNFVPRGLSHFLNGKRHGNDVKAELCSLLQSQKKLIYDAMKKRSELYAPLLRIEITY